MRWTRVRPAGALPCSAPCRWGFRCRRCPLRLPITTPIEASGYPRISLRRSATSSARTRTAGSIAKGCSTRSGTRDLSSVPMSTGLNIPREGALDLLALGALVHRLDPGVVPFHKAQTCAIHVSGGEYNVAANLSDCFRLQTGIATAMVDYPIGQLIAERVQAMGVKPFYKRFTHDGARGPNMAAVYSDRGFGVRPPVVFYNRSNEAATLLKPGDFDWAGIFGKGVRWFHSGGLFTALGEGTDEVIIEGMQAAKNSGAIVSFDLNYREKLWNASGGGHARALEVMSRIVN